MDTLGKRLKYIRNQNSLNQIEFAQKIGVSQGTLSDLEKDKCKPSVDTLISLRVNLGVDVNWLITGESEQSAMHWNKGTWNCTAS
jgi:transcriptional regulator with XRE-family HTH domain